MKYEDWKEGIKDWAYPEEMLKLYFETEGDLITPESFKYDNKALDKILPYWLHATELATELEKTRSL